MAPPLPQKPRRLFLDTNQACNLKCVQCDIHLLRDPADGLDLAERKALLSELAGWSPKTKVLFSGGEPFLRRADLYDLAGHCGELGLRATVNTNGTLFMAQDYKRLPDSGLENVIFSVDHHLAEVHDGIRGVPGTFARATEALRRLATKAHGPKKHLKIMVTAILGRHNMDTLPELCDLSEHLGAAAIFFQPLQPNFERAVPESWWKQHPMWPKNDAQVHHGIDTLLELKASGRHILHKERDLEDMRRYFLAPAQLAPGHCASMRENLMVDMRGNVRFCFSMDRLDLPPLGNVRSESLQSIWENSRGLAQATQGCALECGAMLCHCR